MTQIAELSRQWQGEGGPEAWDEAWDRARELVTSRLSRFEPVGQSDWAVGPAADKVGGLATAPYILALEQRVDPAAVTRRSVEDLLRHREGETDSAIARRWEAHLENLGHDVDDESDPVAVRWRVLRTEYEPNEDLHWDDATCRRGPGLLEGLRYVLSGHVALNF
ncbi:hypothetical protein [Streptomyces zaomyceticus]|uniref:hypothetical protein n=1 Tax=Streptomyces zaomyceticus TaxID=68286 RepID=UPI002E225778